MHSSDEDFLPSDNDFDEDDDLLYLPDTVKKSKKSAKKSIKTPEKFKLAKFFIKKSLSQPITPSLDQPTTSTNPSPVILPILKTEVPQPQEKISCAYWNCNPLWNYFQKQKLTEAMCLTCMRILKIGRCGTTSSLIKHLKTHKPLFDEYVAQKSIFQESKKGKSILIPTPQKRNESKVFDPFTREVKWPPDSEEHKKANDLVTTFIIEGMHPYSIIEERAFRKLMEEGFPNYSLPSRTTMSRTIIPELYSKEKSKLKTVISNNFPSLHSISFTTDRWKSRSGHSYLSLSCHYIDDEFNYKMFSLSNVLVEERQTGENLCNIIKREVEDWGIVNNDKAIPIYVVTEGGKNIVSAMRHTSWNHRECFAHKLQLVVEAAVISEPSAQQMLQKSKAIVDHYNKSAAATARLKKIQSQFGKSPKSVLQMVETQWKSEYCMLERLVELKNAISTDLATSQHSISNLTNEEWELAEGYLNALKPIEVVINIMSSDKYPSTSMIIPVLNEIETKLYEIAYSTSTPKTISFAKYLLLQLKTKFVQYKQDNIHQIATVLDPRFKYVLLDRSLIGNKLIRLADEQSKQLNISNSTVETLPMASVTRTFTTTKTETGIWAAFNVAAAKVKQAFSPSAKEVQRYFEEELADKNVNPYEWWKTGAAKYPILSKLAARYLPIPATRASSERLFSAADNVITARRESLTPDHAKQLLFLHDLFSQKSN